MNCKMETNKFEYKGTEGKGILTENVATVVMPGITREHVFAQISDLHIVAYDESNSESEIANAVHSLKQWGWYAPEIEINGKMVKSIDSAVNLVIDKINELSPEAVFVCGDISDMCLKNCYLHAKDTLSRIKIPYYLTPGNHDKISHNASDDAKTGFYSLFGDCCGESDVSVFKVGEIKVININSSRTAITKKQEEIVLNELKGEPSFILTHEPFFTDTLFKAAGPDFAKYYFVGYETHSEETQICVKNIVNKNPVVLAGHTHVKLDFPDSEPLQLISTPAFSGFYRIVKFIPEN